MAKIEQEVEKILQSHPDWLASYGNGNQKLFGMFVKEVMQNIKNADINLVNITVKKFLENKLKILD